MSTAAWIVITSYFITIAGGLFVFSLWWLTRSNEDKIWRWIFSLIGQLIFISVFWVAYFLGTFAAWWVVLLCIISCYGWLYVVFSTRSSLLIDRLVFAAFGAMVLGMIAIGAYHSGLRGWWAMGVIFYVVSLHTIYSLIEA